MKPGCMKPEVEIFLRPTPSIESEHPEVVAFAKRHAAGASGEIDAAVRLYYAVRDGIRYDPYSAGGDEAGLREGVRAGATLAAGRGWCVAKAVLLAACCRALGIPARLGFADVRNHLSTARMRARMKTDVFYWHGYTSIWLDENWVKATPAFNVELCRKFRLLPLEFDGREDSLYHPFDAEGRRHMEYVKDRGQFADVPFDRILATFQEHYGALLATDWGEAADFDRDVELETS